MCSPATDENLTPQVLAPELAREVSPENANEDTKQDNANSSPLPDNLLSAEIPAEAIPIEAAQALAVTSDNEANNRDIDHEPTPEEYAQWEAMWGEGENQFTRVGRAACTLLVGGFLAWMQFRAIFDTTVRWNEWIWFSVLANFLLPAGVVWLFFAQGLRRLNWLSDHRLNAWNYGCNWQFRRHAKIALLAFAVLAIPMWFLSRDAGTQIFYRNAYFPPIHNTAALLWLLVTLIIYMACWEWFFRGFLLFGMAQGFGPIAAIGLQTVIFGLAHAGKPPVEMWSSFGGGLILGILCWREKSFVPAFFIHALIHVAWAVMILN